jgi:hypothetical protein
MANDESKDYIMTLNEAREQLRQGMLFWDIKNNCYCEPRRTGHVSYRPLKQGRA